MVKKDATQQSDTEGDFYSDNKYHLLRQCHFLTPNSPRFWLPDLVCRECILKKKRVICLSAFRLDSL